MHGCTSEPNFVASSGRLFVRCVSCLLLALILLGCGESKNVTSPPKSNSDAASADSIDPPHTNFEPSLADLTRHNRAVAQMGQFQFETARILFEQFVKEQPQWLAARIDLAIATLNRQQPGDSELAEKIFDEVLQVDPTQLRARHCRGILKLHRGDPTAAQSDFRYVIEHDPADAYAVYFSGRCFFEMGKFEQAKTQFTTAQRLDPYLRSAYYGAMQSAQRLGLKKEVGQLLGDFQKLGNNPQAHLAEIKYTRMGPKAEVRATETASATPSMTVPKGPIFQSVEPLAIANSSDSLWRKRLGIDTQFPSPSATVCDIDADGNLDLFLASSLSGDEEKFNAVLFAEPIASSAERGVAYRLALDHPLTSVEAVEAALWGDYDNDGLTDVYLCRRGPNQLWRQMAAGEWNDVTEQTQTAGGEVDTVGGAFFDADHDGDLDLFLVNSLGPNELLSNNLDGTFRPLAQEQGIVGDSNDSRGVLAIDLDGDRDRDLIVINANAPHEVYLNDRLWNYHRAAGFDPFRQAKCAAAVAADLDADGQVELITWSAGKLLIWGPNESGEWTSRTLASLSADTESNQPGQLELSDVDGDGRLEAIASKAGRCWVVSTAGEGRILFEFDETEVAGWRAALLDPRRGAAIVGLQWGKGPVGLQPGPGRHPHLIVEFSGRDNRAEQMRSNRSGIGIRGAARVGGRWNAFDSLPSSTVAGQSLEPIALGLGGADSADFLSILWPDGVLQTELDLSIDQSHRIEETQRQLSSCPVVFVWNGQQYEFVTDVLGVGGLGFNLARGEYSQPRPWENLLLPEGLLKPRNGKFQLKIGEPMEEACYLDAARLVAYDLPPGWQMTLDERLATADPEPTGQPFFYQKQLVPREASSDRGEDVTQQIQRVDQVAIPPGKLDRRFIGRTEQQTIVMEFDQPLESLLAAEDEDPASSLVLVFHGWIEYPYSQTMFAAWQAGAEYQSPTLEARDAEGNWQIVLEQFGYMAGMPREAAVPLPSLPAGCSALRLKTNCEIYWDHVKVVAAKACPKVRRRELSLQQARVLQAGFARRTTRPDRLPEYDYQQRSPLWDTRHMAGFYTAFGEALPLLDRRDDALAIIGPGEEIHLEFQAPTEPPSHGWSRRIVLECDGWCKDMDLYTHEGEQVGPLPVREPENNEESYQSNRKALHQQFNRRFREGP